MCPTAVPSPHRKLMHELYDARVCLAGVFPRRVARVERTTPGSSRASSRFSHEGGSFDHHTRVPSARPTPCSVRASPARSRHLNDD